MVRKLSVLCDGIPDVRRPELIQVGKTGELFESGNAKDLKQKIEKLWGDKKLCEEYSKNCKNISFDTIDEYCEKIITVYQ